MTLRHYSIDHDTTSVTPLSQSATFNHFWDASKFQLYMKHVMKREYSSSIKDFSPCLLLNQLDYLHGFVIKDNGVHAA